MQTITQTKKYRCVSLLRPLPQPEPERIQQPRIPKRPSSSVTRSPSVGPKLPSSGTKLSTSVPKSPYSVTKPPPSVSKSPSSVSKSPSSVPKPSPSSNLKLPPDSFSLFKLPLQLISSLLSPLMPHTIRQNTTSVITPLVNFQMPLTFSTIHSPNASPCITNNLPVPCNPQPGIINNLPISYNTVPAGNINNSPMSSSCNPESNSDNPNPEVEIIKNFPSPLPGIKNTNNTHIPCNSNVNIKNVPNSGNTLTGKNNNTSPCNSRLDNTNNTSYIFPYHPFSGNSPIKALIHKLLCDFFMKNINGFKCTASIDIVSSTPKPCKELIVNSTPPYMSTSIVVTPPNSTPQDDFPPSTPDYEIITFTTNSPIATPGGDSTTPCIYPPSRKICKTCNLSPIRVPKPIPCKTYNIPHTCKGPLDHPYSVHSLNHESSVTPNANLNSLFKSKLDKSNQLPLNKDEIILKTLETLISTLNS